MKKFTTLMMTLFAILSTNAQTDMIYKETPAKEITTVKGNRWGLVYDGALTENRPGKVNIHPITYKSLIGNDIRANVYTPADYDTAKKYPAIILAHPNGGVKEQVTGLYAQMLAEKGYITMAMDAQFQGASGGEPRHTDIPYYRMEDIRRAADILTQYPGVDPGRLGALGICGGGGYVAKETQTDKRFKAIATLSAFNTGVVRRNGFLDSELNTVQQRLAAASEAREASARGEKPELRGDMSKVTPEIADKMAFDLYREGFYYYFVNYAHPNSNFLYTKASLLELMDFDAAEGMELTDRPLLMIAGKNSDCLYLSESIISKATSAPYRELYLIPGATHIQTYHVKEYVDQAMAKLTDFFDRYLK